MINRLTLRFPFAGALCAIALASFGCTKEEPMDMSDAGKLAPMKNYLITLNGSHSHIYKKVAQLFTVYDMDTCTDASKLETCQKVPGLKAVGFFRAPGADSAEEVGLEAGKLEDNGDGTYTFYTQFGAYGPHVVGLKFEQDGNRYFSAFPFETSRAGGERYLCDADGDGKKDFSYMIRWSNSGVHVMADGKTEVAFAVELMRSTNTPVNETEPWKNIFDHLAPTALTAAPTIKLMGDAAPDAKEIATLTPNYLGKGIYEVRHTFMNEEMAGGMDRTFWLSISFKDNQNCSVTGTDDAAEYYFPVTAMTM